MKANIPSLTYKSGYLQLDNLHKIYYELSGNPRGQPIIFIHGGPGGGFTEKDKRYFNPKLFNIIHYDQRGAGKSKPFASLTDNTTQNLISDITLLLNTLGIKKTMMFGGSWGSTLSLCYAIKNPERVSALILRGIFLASKKENNYFTYEARNIYPEAWEKLAKLVPKKEIEKRKIEQYYYKKIKSKNIKTRHKYTLAWARYEGSISKLIYSKEKITQFLKEVKPDVFSTIELHYLNHFCFLPKNYILKNSYRIKNIPCSIIHGRYDCVCSPSAAYALHKALPKSKLFFTLAGHSSSDKENEKLLIGETNRLANLIN